jgi:hypothetical protein
MRVRAQKLRGMACRVFGFADERVTECRCAGFVDERVVIAGVAGSKKVKGFDCGDARTLDLSWSGFWMMFPSSVPF